MISDAHHTSANYESGVSEFSKTNLKEEYKEGIAFPLQRQSSATILQVCK
jgi:hypothetical protein